MGIETRGLLYGVACPLVNIYLQEPWMQNSSDSCEAAGPIWRHKMRDMPRAPRMSCLYRHLQRARHFG